MSLNPALRDWSGQVAWVVGASSGIGLATAGLLAARGARVVVSARQTAPLQQFVQRHPGALALPADVTSREQIGQACDDLLAATGRLDLVMVCAGHYRPQRATAFDLADMLRHQQVNYVGALNVLDAVLPVLLRQRAGHLSLVASVAGYRGLPNALAYGPTKAALIGLAEVLWMDLHDQGLGVSVINPGFVATPLTAQNPFVMPALITPDEAARQILSGWAAGDFEIHFPKRFSRFLKLLGLLPDRLYFGLIRKGTGL
ncbi:NADP-dependent 3-hydroxy acid dehydrogenase YdfG [Sphaerotilus hippei]|uniref:NADP-dependent 3-hydroxy acid dehydrogenase YdfG n=1 Tax=Sphaerotilus hippei TaxID=744406 RepID=A0A318H3Y6_9BURK|nr:SDR family NAD(P)-dependent oxidoreductase [Sphaerotilus hippei]PXW95840.1 NADP-dependent 3-hydroxy acid dehydrogenase YdfG [Sphaerotilus hippei]